MKEIVKPQFQAKLIDWAQRISDQHKKVGKLICKSTSLGKSLSEGETVVVIGVHRSFSAFADFADFF